jgi:hypothetical protein
MYEALSRDLVLYIGASVWYIVQMENGFRMLRGAMISSPGETSSGKLAWFGRCERNRSNSYKFTILTMPPID